MAKALNAGFIMERTIMSQAEYVRLVYESIASDGTGAFVNLPRGTIELTSSPVSPDDGEPLWKQIRGGGQRGHGLQATEFLWLGGLTEPALVVDRCQGVTFSGFGIRAQASNPLLEGIRVQQGTVVNGNKRFNNLTSSLNTFRDIEIAGAGVTGTGGRLYLASAVLTDDDKNDHMAFENWHVTGCRNAGLVLEGRNAKAILVRRYIFTGTIGSSQLCDYGVFTVANFCPLTMNANGTIGTRGDPARNGGAPIYNHGASFSVIGGQMSGTLVSNVLIGDRNDSLLLMDLYSEKSATWLKVPDYGQGSSGAFPIKLVCLKYSVNNNTPANNEIIDVRSENLSVEDCEFGQRVAGQQIRIRFQPTNSPGAFVLDGNAITNDGDGNVFAYQAPTNTDYPSTNTGYRAGVLGLLGPGIAVPTDGPALRIYPQSVAQWQFVGLPPPQSQWSFSGTVPTPIWTTSTDVLAGEYTVNGTEVYLCVSDGTTAAVGPGPVGVGAGIVDGTAVWNWYGTGKGVIGDQVSFKDLLIVNNYTFNQALAGFAQTFLLQPEVAATALKLNSTAYSPITDAITVMVDFQIVASGGNRKFLQLGNTNTTVGGGGIVFIITAAGLLQVNCNGVTVNGVINYEGDGIVHRAIATWDPAGAGSLFVATDAEKVVGVPDPANVLNNSDKGFGAPASTAVQSYLGGYPAWWSGPDALTIALSASRTLLGVNAT